MVLKANRDRPLIPMSSALPIPCNIKLQTLNFKLAPHSIRRQQPPEPVHQDDNQESDIPWHDPGPEEGFGAGEISFHLGSHTIGKAQHPVHRPGPLRQGVDPHGWYSLHTHCGTGQGTNDGPGGVGITAQFYNAPYGFVIVAQVPEEGK